MLANRQGTISKYSSGNTVHKASFVICQREEDHFKSKHADYNMYGKALSVLLWVVQDRHATMGKHIAILVSESRVEQCSEKTPPVFG